MRGRDRHRPGATSNRHLPLKSRSKSRDDRLIGATLRGRGAELTCGTMATSSTTDNVIKTSVSYDNARDLCLIASFSR